MSSASTEMSVLLPMPGPPPEPIPCWRKYPKARAAAISTVRKRIVLTRQKNFSPRKSPGAIWRFGSAESRLLRWGIPAEVSFSPFPTCCRRWGATFFLPFLGGNALPAKNKLLFLLPKTIIVSSKWTTITRKILINRQGKSIRQVSPSF